jgi:hypothetical protein
MTTHQTDSARQRRIILPSTLVGFVDLGVTVWPVERALKSSEAETVFDFVQSITLPIDATDEGSVRHLNGDVLPILTNPRQSGFVPVTLSDIDEMFQDARSNQEIVSVADFFGNVRANQVFSLRSARGASLAALYCAIADKQAFGTCGRCGALFSSTLRSTGKFCSEKCRTYVAQQKFRAKA